MKPWTSRNFARGPLRNWLQASGSLSARLAATGSVFSVQVLRQGREALTPDEAQALGVARGCAGYAREVLLRVDDHARVFARSVTTHADSLGAWRSVRGLGTRPLADVLFKRSGISRGPLSYTQLAPTTVLRRRVSQHLHVSLNPTPQAHDNLTRSLSARRSAFERRGRPLLVMEVFIAPSSVWCAPSRVHSHAQERFKP
ncbi:chorismate lyase [Rhodoferax sp.]|uniref:chorismate--pyruvate lyase family protein n=1 Tax=Rhodoferax sp. TaxID=50421 RepID=UPI00284B8FCE|nr:chorismate lyase [Rhodoferax sp.]MDR3368510.1 chorismate lyase [Rhodoferax sp.]